MMRVIYALLEDYWLHRRSCSALEPINSNKGTPIPDRRSVAQWCSSYCDMEILRRTERHLQSRKRRNSRGGSYKRVSRRHHFWYGAGRKWQVWHAHAGWRMALMVEEHKSDMQLHCKGNDKHRSRIKYSEENRCSLPMRTIPGSVPDKCRITGR